jgi:pimeloyl-ACP methyl ester carboxylesterase
MQIAANGIALEVEDHGPAGGEPLVLIMGLGMQLVAWHEDFVAMLVGQGFRVIRFDNRDIGLSQRFDNVGVPNLALDAMRHTFGLAVKSPYTIANMADDTAALLDVLGLSKAHVCGASMGGMIAQHLAVRHPQRVKSLTLMMTTSGARHLPQPRWKVQLSMLSRPANPRDVDSVIDHYVRIYRLIGSPAYPATEAYLRDRLGMAVRRSHRPAAVARQLVAIAADGDRSPLLPRIQAPTQVIHGLADPLVPVDAGRDLARQIAGAQLDLIEGMGHDLPTPLWPRFVADIRAAAARA